MEQMNIIFKSGVHSNMGTWSLLYFTWR